LTLWESFIRTSLPVTALFVHLSTPPLEVIRKSRIDKAEKDNHNTKSKTRVESSAQSHGVLAPPGVVAVLDEIVEDVADKYPDRKVEACGGRDPGHGAEDDRKVHLAEDTRTMLSTVEP
jgi:hypothetical protein